MEAGRTKLINPETTMPTALPSSSGVDRPLLLPVVLRAFKVTGMAAFVWFWGYLGMSIAWVYVALCFYVAGNECRKIKKAKKMYAYQAIANEKEAVLSRIDDDLSWVYFPNVEKAEWFNKILKQMWPYIDEYVHALLYTKIEKSIRDSLPPTFSNFKFETADLGEMPVRIDGFQIFSDPTQKDEIICDIDVRYAGDAKIKISVNNLGAGIRNLNIVGTVRIIIKPLVDKVPIIGGLSIFFLNRPAVFFDLTDAANFLDMPILKKVLRTIVQDQIARYLVLPNRIPVQLAEDIDISTLKYPAPQGVLELYIVEARDLIGADSHIIGSSTSDPYCCITVGANVFKTKRIKKTLKPKWNQRFEIIVDQKYGQSVVVEVKDADIAGADDSLGIMSFDVETVAKKDQMDLWQPLEKVNTGSLHIKARWLKLSQDLNDLPNEASFDNRNGVDDLVSNAVVIIFLDKASNLPRGSTSKAERNAFVTFTVGPQSQKSTVVNRNSHPCWNESFQFLVGNPHKDVCTVELCHRSSGDKTLGSLSFPINELFTCENLTESKVLFFSDVASNCTVFVRLTLRIMKWKQEQISSASSTMLNTIAEAILNQKNVNIAAVSAKEVYSVAKSANRGVGMIELTARYSTERNQLIVSVHQCRDLVTCDEDRSSYTFVSIGLLHPNQPMGSKKKTAAIKNSSDPVFNERLEWSLQLSDISSCCLDVSVKDSTSGGSKVKSTIGQTVIPLSSFSNLKTEAKPYWYNPPQNELIQMVK